MSTQDDPSMTADVIAAPRRLALIDAASFLVPLSLVVLAYGAFAWRVSLQAAKEVTSGRIAERIQVAGEPLPSAQTAVAQQPVICSPSQPSEHTATGHCPDGR
jgi:hypothetical protein